MIIKVDEWQGFRREFLEFEGHEVIVAVPNIPVADKERKWVWRTEFFGAFPSADIAMLQKGYHVLQLVISDKFGCPSAVDCMARFHDFIVDEYKLEKKSALFGFSRGGLYALHYAAKCPQNVSVLYLDAPVVDLASWPGGKGAGCGSEHDWELALEAFALSNETAELYTNLMALSINSALSARLPLIIVAGDSDAVVPFNENGIILQTEWEKTDVPFKLILKPNVDHHPHSLEDPTEIVEFILENE